MVGLEALQREIRRIGIVYREETPDVLIIVDRIRSWAAAKAIEIEVEEHLDHRPSAGLDLERGPVDLLVALGGDGTLLRAARMVESEVTPVLGVNLGRLGFLTAIPDSYLEGGLDEVVKGRAVLDRRFRLSAVVYRNGEAVSERFLALNDAVVHASGAARVTPLTLSVGPGDEVQEVGSFAADGVIVATPTGSTAYSLSAGGPVIAPAVEAVVVTPICPHSLSVRPLVLPAEHLIRIGCLDDASEHRLTVDGQVVYRLAPGDEVLVSRAEGFLDLVRFPGQTFFGTMQRKLNWAARPPERA